jgi:pSer/pThr/pTyr-binding forkhead associated (FHA) protein
MAKIKVFRGRAHLFDKRLDGDEVVIGRSGEAEIPLDSPAASRKHVRLTRRQWNWYAEHLGQKNPAMLNKRPFTMQKLNHGDTILIAEHTLVFEYPRSEQQREKAMFEGQKGASFRMGVQDIESALDTGSRNEAMIEAARQAAVEANATQAVSPDELDRLFKSMEKRRAAHLVLAADGKRTEFPLEGRTIDIGWVGGASVRLPGSRLFGRIGARLQSDEGGTHRITPASSWVKVVVGGSPVSGDHPLQDGDILELKHALGFGRVKLKYEGAVAITPTAGRGRAR